MIDRKKKLRIIQFSLLILSLIIIYLTYYNKEDSNTDLVEAEQVKEALKDEGDKDLFFNIEYTGLDLRGNRYLLKSEKARLDELKPESAQTPKVSRAHPAKNIRCEI